MARWHPGGRKAQHCGDHDGQGNNTESNLLAQEKVCAEHQHDRDGAEEQYHQMCLSKLGTY